MLLCGLSASLALSAEELGTQFVSISKRFSVDARQRAAPQIDRSRYTSRSTNQKTGQSATQAQAPDVHGEIFKPHFGGDKHTKPDFVSAYSRHLLPYARGAGFNLLEIGIFRGESLATWSVLLPLARITGLDGNLEPFRANFDALTAQGAFPKGRPRELLGFSTDVSGPVTRVEDASVDVLIDDGCHLLRCMLDNIPLWMPKVRQDGLYIVEDTPASGLPENVTVSRICAAFARAQPLTWYMDSAQLNPLVLSRSASKLSDGGTTPLSCDSHQPVHGKALANGRHSRPTNGRDSRKRLGAKL